MHQLVGTHIRGIWTYADSLLDTKLKLQIATDLRDTIDMYQGQEYPKFLAKMIPVFTTILKGPPVFSNSSPEQVWQPYSPLGTNMANGHIRNYGTVSSILYIDSHFSLPNVLNVMHLS